jgi:hypothetical protein
VHTIDPHWHEQLSAQLLVGSLLPITPVDSSKPQLWPDLHGNDCT